ncbi:DUF1398 domain-containing protein [Parasegetibacter sp. NRK P23]|uniref:DUF1398 domain-containing protein n=1 Tax=Parasegetibacter sp. NRK P23 TaxID=2942999 RepID=UPI002043DE57|nr:DUF1398 family protein [Parasegetibacter sp. NRK P23]MCM5528210.1 DUF1398 domain-containing protein [Parasegetibacter sp. NRK P23]
MFTTEQIKAAHSKVKSGADFPAYIHEIRKMGVTHYEAYVSDGHIDYHGSDGHRVTVPAKYAPLPIATLPKVAEFKAELLAHQQGKTDYLSFIRMCADCGIERWMVSMEKMTCIYYDKSGEKIVEEQIPELS